MILSSPTSPTVMKLSFLEDLEIQHCDSQLNLKAIGHSCPLLKTVKVNRWNFRYLVSSECDDDALAIAETMPQLRHLELLGNELTNTGLNAILDNLQIKVFQVVQIGALICACVSTLTLLEI